MADPPQHHLYSILDQALETGFPVEIERKGHTLRIVPDTAVCKWERLTPRRAVDGDPDDLVHLDWSREWSDRDALP